MSDTNQELREFLLHSIERAFTAELLAKLKAAGYTKAWLGAGQPWESPPWWRDRGTTCVLAAPYIRRGHWSDDIPLWAILRQPNTVKRYGAPDCWGRIGCAMGCGNGCSPYGVNAFVNWTIRGAGAFQFNVTSGVYDLTQPITVLCPWLVPEA